MTTLRQVAQRAEDLDRAVDFYENVIGLRKIARFDPPGLAFFALGQVRLLLEKGAPSSLIYLDVDDIEATVASLVARDVTVASEPHLVFVDETGTFGKPGTEEWMAFVRDSEGNLLGLIERRLGTAD